MVHRGSEPAFEAGGTYDLLATFLKYVNVQGNCSGWTSSSSAIVCRVPRAARRLAIRASCESVSDGAPYCHRISYH